MHGKSKKKKSDENWRCHVHIHTTLIKIKIGLAIHDSHKNPAHLKIWEFAHQKEHFSNLFDFFPPCLFYKQSKCLGMIIFETKTLFKVTPTDILSTSFKFVLPFKPGSLALAAYCFVWPLHGESEKRSPLRKADKGSCDKTAITAACCLISAATQRLAV